MKQDLQLDLDIYPIWYKPFWKGWPFITLAAVLLLGLLVYLAYKLRRNQVPIEVEEDQSILQQLKELKVPKSNTREAKKKFYSELVAIVKRMFHVHESTNLSGKTESEIFTFLSSKNKSMAEKLRPVIESAVIVKYSNDDLYTQMSLDKKLVTIVATKLGGENEV